MTDEQIIRKFAAKVLRLYRDHECSDIDGAALRSASARGRELIGMTGSAKWAWKPPSVDLAKAVQNHTNMAGDLCSWRHVDLCKAGQQIIRQNLRDSYPIWVKK